MKYYESPAGELFAYEEDGSQDSYIGEGLVLISAERLAEIRTRQQEQSAPTPDQVMQLSQLKRDELMSIAALRISPLQNAADLGEATASEEESLKKWKQYCVAVNRVTNQPGFPYVVDWPQQPS